MSAMYQVYLSCYKQSVDAIARRCMTVFATVELDAAVLASGVTAKLHVGYIMIEFEQPIPPQFYDFLNGIADIFDYAVYSLLDDGEPAQDHHVTPHD